MARRPDDKPRRGGRSAHGSNQPRSVIISKAFSKLLRHQAQSERIPISPEGWVKVSDVLGWRGLDRVVKDSGGAEVTLREVAAVVGDNDKKRLALLWVMDPLTTQLEVTAEAEGADATSGLLVPESEPAEDDEAGTTTDRAISAITSDTDTDPSHYRIRAVQGHSMRSVGTDDLLVPVTLSNLSSITSDDLVVHGTFYGAWRAILQSGGLKRMGRNHVHFAGGPKVHEILPDVADGAEGNEGAVVKKLEHNTVISGMRRDAQILIYVNVKTALEELQGIQWWRSENGVVLTEGIEINQGNDDVVDEEDEEPADAGSKADQKAVRTSKKNTHNREAAEIGKIVPISCWEMVVEIKHGFGIIWKKGEGVFKELPQKLLDQKMPQGKVRGAGGMGRGRGRAR